MLAHLCHQPLIEKTRYELTLDGVAWDVDVLLGLNEGLVIGGVWRSGWEAGRSLCRPGSAPRVAEDQVYVSSRLAERPPRGRALRERGLASAPS